jgi:hypothetical protein
MRLKRSQSSSGSLVRSIAFHRRVSRLVLSSSDRFARMMRRVSLVTILSVRKFMVRGVLGWWGG